MIEKGKISALQMAIMIYPTIMATAVLLVPAITGKFAKQDMWLSPVWASSIVFLSAYLVHQLNNRYPKQTVIQYSVEILGFIPGKVIGFVFLFFYLHVNGIILREYGEFIVGNFLIMPSVMGAIVPSSWFSEFFLLSFLLPFLGEKEKGLKWGMISVFAVMVTLVITNLFSLFLFGGITATFTYPVMSASRYINIADFLQHLESIVMAIWVAGTFVKISVFYYAIVIGTAEWLNLSDYRPIVFPLGFLLALIGIWSAPNLEELAHFLGTTSPFYLISIQTLLPMLLLLLAIIRKGNGTKRQESCSTRNK